MPEETDGGSDDEETLTGHVFPVLLAIRLMEGVEQRRIDDSTRPYHARWLHEEFPEQAG